MLHSRRCLTPLAQFMVIESLYAGFVFFPPAADGAHIVGRWRYHAQVRCIVGMKNSFAGSFGIRCISRLSNPSCCITSGTQEAPGPGPRRRPAYWSHVLMPAVSAWLLSSRNHPGGGKNNQHTVRAIAAACLHPAPGKKMCFPFRNGNGTVADRSRFKENHIADQVIKTLRIFAC
jgi:hypothetical protein